MKTGRQLTDSESIILQKKKKLNKPRILRFLELIFTVGKLVFCSSKRYSFYIWCFTYPQLIGQIILYRKGYIIQILMKHQKSIQDRLKLQGSVFPFRR